MSDEVTMKPEENVVLFCNPETAAYILNLTDDDEHKAAFAGSVIVGNIFPTEDHVVYIVNVEKFIDFIDNNSKILTQTDENSENPEEDTNDAAGNGTEDSEPVENG